LWLTGSTRHDGPPARAEAKELPTAEEPMEVIMKRHLLSLVFILALSITLAPAFAAPEAKAKEWLLKGSLQANETDTLEFPTLSVNGTGSGHTTNLGRFTITYQAIVDIRTRAGVGSVQLVAANGDSLLATGTGQATPTGTPGVVQIEEQYTMTGGTGRFAAASGSFTVNRELNQTTGMTSGTIAGEIVLR
jgi:hypothetical protein